MSSLCILSIGANGAFSFGNLDNLRNDCIRGALLYLNLGRWEKETSCLKIANNEITKIGISFMLAIIKDFDSYESRMGGKGA